MFFTIPNFLERLIDEPMSIIGVLSITAIITTISLFFCGIPICVEIWNRKSTNEISGFPFLMGFLGGSFWLRYGILKLDLTMIIVNVVGVTLMFLYLLFYVYYTKSKTLILFELSIVMALISGMLIIVGIYNLNVLDELGFICMTFNIVNFGAPLAGLAVVFEKRSCESLPLPLCSANILVSFQWCLYGILEKDRYIVIPNGAGVALALIQIFLFFIFPRKAGSKAPLAYCFKCLRNLELNEKPKIIIDGVSEFQNGFDLGRQRNLKNEIPSSRKACIEYLRSNVFNAGGYYVYGKNNPSNEKKTTLNDTYTIGVGKELSRVSSVSHPELWNVSQIVISAMGNDDDFSDEKNNNIFNKSSNSGSFFNYSRSGHLNPLFNNSNASTQYFTTLAAAASASGRQSLHQLQQLQLHLQSQQQNSTEQQMVNMPFEFNKITEIDDLDRQWTENEFKRTLSAPDLAS